MMWDERYSEQGFAYGVEPNDFLEAILPTLNLPKDASCLFLAEGEGRNAVWAAEQGFQVVAVDSSKVGLEKAQTLARERGVSIQTEVADLGDYDLDVAKWDCIVGIFCHLPPMIRQRVLAAIPEALKPGGVFVLEGYTPQQLEYKTGGPHASDLMYTSEILKTALEGKLEIDRNEELMREVVEGKYHNGLAAVVQCIARKPLAK
jgi:SAM-dependent methyltransferase